MPGALRKASKIPPDHTVAVLRPGVAVLRPGVAVLCPGVAVLCPGVAVLCPCVAVLRPCVAVLCPCVAVLRPCVAVLRPSVAVLRPGAAVLRPGVAVLRPPCSRQTPRLSDPATAHNGGTIIWPGGNSGAVAQSLFPRNASVHREFRFFAAAQNDKVEAGHCADPASLSQLVHPLQLPLIPHARITAQKRYTQVRSVVFILHKRQRRSWPGCLF